MKNRIPLALLALLAIPLLGCGSEQAPGYDSASRDAAEALAKNGNDISKLTPQQKADLERVAGKSRGMGSTNGGGATPSNGG